MANLNLIFDLRKVHFGPISHSTQKNLKIPSCIPHFSTLIPTIPPPTIHDSSDSRKNCESHSLIIHVPLTWTNLPFKLLKYSLL